MSTVKSKTQQALEKQLSEKQKQLSKTERELELIKKKLESENNKNKPKNIIDIVKSYEDACKYNKEKPVHVYKNNKSGDTIDEIAYKRLKYIFKTLNENHKFSMKPDEKRYYPWFVLDSSSPSGLAFYDSSFDIDVAVASSAARLCFKNYELATHAGTCESILDDWSKFIM